MIPRPLCDKEVAALPGAPSVHTLRAARRGRRLDVPAHTRLAGRVRYRVEDVFQWLTAHGIETIEDLR